MIDIFNYKMYKDTERLVAILVDNELPPMLWKTYSALANTKGGLIILGASVNELTKDVVIVGLNNPQELLKSFWEIINNVSLVSKNVLFSNDVIIKEVDGKKIILIELSLDNLRTKPIYLNQDIDNQTYFYYDNKVIRVKNADIKRFIGEYWSKGLEGTVLNKFPKASLNSDTLSEYLDYASVANPNLTSNMLDPEEFLYKNGMLRNSCVDGKLYPTIAGLLLFGNVNDIRKVLPNYYLEYVEFSSEKKDKVLDRITSNSNTWSGNLFDFYLNVHNKLTYDLKVPNSLNEKQRITHNKDMCFSITEAFVNALIHADYTKPGIIKITKIKNKITFSNPGRLGTNKKQIYVGGSSSLNNPLLMHMFSLIKLADRSGYGVYRIYKTFAEYNYLNFELIENINPDYVELQLDFEPSS